MEIIRNHISQRILSVADKQEERPDIAQLEYRRSAVWVVGDRLPERQESFLYSTVSKPALEST
jgi:hypothetical protein